MRRIPALLLVCLGWTASLSATSALTRITGTIVGPGGSNPSGTVTISWQRTQNDANPRQTIFPGRMTYPITSGVFDVSLFPNSAMLPAGTCYQADWTLNNVNSRSYLTVPVSPTPVDIGLVQGNIPCANQPGPIVAPGQISSGGATLNQVLTYNGNYWAPAAGGGGGGGNPGGTSGQIQFNNSGAFGGFTLAGDCSITLPPTIICTKTNGVLFAASATVNTTNAANISTGTLLPVVGGTGAGVFTPNSVPFVGAAGVYQQSNPNFYYDLANFRLGLSSTGANLASIRIDNAAGGNQTRISFYDAGVEKFQIGKQTTNSFYLLDSANSRDALRVVSGNVLLDPLGGNTLIGGTVDGGYRADVQSGDNTFRVFNQATGGTTLAVITAGLNQEIAGTDLLQFKDNSGGVIAEIGHSGQFISSTSLGVGSSLNGRVSSGLSLSSTKGVVWSSTTAWFDAPDTGIYKISSGLLGIGNGTGGDFSGSLKLANITLTGSGFTGGGTLNLCVDNAGLITTSGCTGGGGGGGTVTHTTGPLTAGRLVLGNGSNDVTILGSSGTTTTVYHGNAGGTGSFSAVSLTADVTGILPFANGGTGTATNFTNHFFFGNSSGGTAAPVAVQPTFADLAAGTVGAKATFPGGDLFCGGVNAQTGTSYTIATSDECKLTTFNNGSATAVTLPQATTAGFTSGAYFLVYNIGAGAVTITPTTSTINGGATIVLNQSQGAWIHSDGTDYSAWVSAAPTGSGTVTSITFSSPLGGGTITGSGTVDCATCVTSAAALTSNQLVIGGGSQASQALGSLGTATTVLHGNAGGAPAFSAVSLTADVTGVLPNANTTATSANTASAIVARDGSGNFSGGTFTGNVTGNLTGNVTGNLTGNVTGNASGTAATITGLLTSANIPKIDVLDATSNCADAGSTDAYACNLSPAVTGYVTGIHYRFKANTTNVGASTVNFNSLGAKTIKKAAGGITTDLYDNDIRAGQWVDLVYDGTNMQMQSLLGNIRSTAVAPAFSATPTFDIGDLSSELIRPGVLSANVTNVIFAGLRPGAHFWIEWTQAASGGPYTINYGTSVSSIWTPCNISPIASAHTRQEFQVEDDGTTVDAVGCTDNSLGWSYSSTVTAQTSVSITAAVHGKGTTPIVTCLDNATPRLAVACSWTRSSVGDVVLTFAPAFTGVVEIRP